MARLNYYGLGSQRDKARRRGGMTGSMRLGIVFAVLVAINIYVFFFRGGTSINDVLKASAINKKASVLTQADSEKEARNQAADPLARQDDSIVVKGSLKGHLGLSPALIAYKLDSAQAEEVIAALRPVLNMRSLRPEQTFEIRLDPRNGRLRQFLYRASALQTVVVDRGIDGGLKAKVAEKKLETRIARVGGRIESSLAQALAQAGESSSLASSFVDLFSWDINWYTDPRENDEFRIVVEKQYLEGEFYRYGEILAAEYSGDVGRFQAFYFDPQGAPGGHYMPEGRSVQRPFLKTPLNFRRISSHFNKHRFHPVLHRTKGHFGIDYAAATGTPIYAAADGSVASAGPSGGAGNMIVLRHADGIQTIYMHLSRFARGLKAGKKVVQREVIGYVGSTGLSTGPHLHFGVKQHSRYIDPVKFKAGKGKMLPKAERIRFLDGLPKRLAELEAIDVRGRVTAAK